MILGSKLSTKVILTDSYIQISKYYVLCCRNSNKIYNYINIKSFHLNIKTTIDVDGGKNNNINIIYLDISNKENCLFNYDTYGSTEEAEYFVYVANDFINKNRNMITIS